MTNKKEACVDISYCDSYTKYLKEGKKYCLICSREIHENVKKASDKSTEDGMFKHASLDL